MANEANLTQKEINNLIEAGHGESVDELIKTKLTPEQQQAVRAVLADPEKLKKILSSPFAKKFVDSINRKSGNGGV